MHIASSRTLIALRDHYLCMWGDNLLRPCQHNEGYHHQQKTLSKTCSDTAISLHITVVANGLISLRAPCSISTAQCTHTSLRIHAQFLRGAGDIHVNCTNDAPGLIMVMIGKLVAISSTAKEYLSRIRPPTVESNCTGNYSLVELCRPQRARD